jgi:hypothetical protein
MTSSAHNTSCIARNACVVDNVSVGSVSAVRSATVVRIEQVWGLADMAVVYRAADRTIGVIARNTFISLSNVSWSTFLNTFISSEFKTGGALITVVSSAEQASNFARNAITVNESSLVGAV